MMKDVSHPRTRYAAAALAGAILLLAESNAAGEAASGAVKLCAAVIIPSLFPYMAVAGMMVSLGTAQLLGKRLSALTRRLFRLPGESASALLLGALCGFPIGAQTACALYEKNHLTKEQTERLIALANNTGPAFVIEVVGAHCWGRRGLGLTVYLSQIAAALLVGILYARRHPVSDEIPPHTDRKSIVRSQQKDILTVVADTVSSAAISVLVICGFVVFFAVVLSLSARVLTKIGANSALPFLGVILEFTNGTAYAAKMGGIPGAFLTGFAVGWSGISVFAQCKVFTAPLEIRLTPAAICKTAQGILTGAAAAVYYRFFFKASAIASTCLPVTDTPEMLVLVEVSLLILFCLSPALYQKSKEAGVSS